jgi:hypothetical protein
MHHFLLVVVLITFALVLGVVFSIKIKQAIEDLEATFETRLRALETAVKAKL